MPVARKYAGNTSALPRIFLDSLTLEDGTDSFFWNDNKLLPIYAT